MIILGINRIFGRQVAHPTVCVRYLAEKLSNERDDLSEYQYVDIRAEKIKKRSTTRRAKPGKAVRKDLTVNEKSETPDII